MAASPWASLLAWPLITPAERSLRRLVDCRVDRRRHRAQLSSNELEARTGTDLHESATADPNTDRQLQPDTRVPYTLQLQPRSRDAAHVTLADFEDDCCRGECCAISPPDYTLGFMLRPVQQNQRAALTAGQRARLIRNQGEASRYGKTGRVAMQEGNMRMIERCPVNTHYHANFLGSGEDIRAIDGCSSFVDIDELQLTGGDDVVFMQLGQ